MDRLEKLQFIVKSDDPIAVIMTAQYAALYASIDALNDEIRGVQTRIDSHLKVMEAYEMLMTQRYDELHTKVPE